MFNWLQHLFTARALKRELSELRSENGSLKLEIDKLKLDVAIKDELISGLEKLITEENANRPRIADGVTPNLFDL